MVNNMNSPASAFIDDINSTGDSKIKPLDSNNHNFALVDNF